MFDVSWEDPASETVAQHRERKQRDGKTSAQGSTSSSMKSAESSDSSGTQNTSIPIKSVQVSNHQKNTTPKRGISLLKNAKLPLTRKKPSFATAGISPDSQQTITGVQRSVSGDNGDVSDSIQSAPLSNGRSNVTGSPWSLVMDNPSKSYEIQTLAKNSFVTRSTKVTTSSQDSTNVLNASMSEVSISAEALSPDDYTIEIGSDTFQFPRIPRQSSVNEAEVEAEGSTFPSHRKVETTSPTTKKPAEFWKPPIDWGCPSGDSAHSHLRNKADKRKSRQLSHDDSIGPHTGQTHLQRHIRRMVAANPKIMLERIREEWTEINDATIYKELEFEKQLWMLAALGYLGKNLDSNYGGTISQQEGTSLPQRGRSGHSKVLSLYENQASASFLGTFITATEIHHLSTSPLPPSSLPDVYPLTVPNPHHHLPYASQLFSSISSLCLPVILPSSSIPSLLRECHRVLLSSGTLCLTILDPTPDSATLGPRMRAWLEKHLLLNLERHFRCMSPGRLLPIWLKDAGFSCNAKGAKVSLIRFKATANEGGDSAELRAVIGRMLWKEIWGGFVEGKKWWWEDEAVMEECTRLETRWECALVEAVKAS